MRETKPIGRRWHRSTAPRYCRGDRHWSALVRALSSRPGRRSCDVGRRGRRRARGARPSRRKIGANNSRASSSRPWSPKSRAKLVATRSSKPLVPCSCAIDRAARRERSALSRSGRGNRHSKSPRNRWSSASYHLYGWFTEGFDFADLAEAKALLTASAWAAAEPVTILRAPPAPRRRSQSSRRSHPGRGPCPGSRP